MKIFLQTLTTFVKASPVAGFEQGGSLVVVGEKLRGLPDQRVKNSRFYLIELGRQSLLHVLCKDCLGVVALARCVLEEVNNRISWKQMERLCALK